MTNFQDKANFIWSIADLLRGDYKQAEYGKVILPFTVLKRLDDVLKPNKAAVLSMHQKISGKPEEAIDTILNGTSGYKYFHNHSKYDFESLLAEPDKIAANLRNYVAGFSKTVRDIFESFSFETQIQRLDKANLLYQMVKEFKSINLGSLSGLEMGYIFEHLIYKFAEASNETAGEHFTPREVIELMVHVLFQNDKQFHKSGTILNAYDPACGTGGMLTIAEDYFKAHNEDPDASILNLYGQDINEEIYAICKSDLMIKGQNPENIQFGNSFTDDKFPHETFDYMLCNPPFGVNWGKKADVKKFIKDEYDKQGFGGRFGAGLPPVSDGSLLFLQHLISKMKDPKTTDGSRIGIVFSGSPLFTGSAGSGPSEIRKWIIENDMLEGVIALPSQLFYNTGIGTYIWIVTNKKESLRKGKIQLVNAVNIYEKMKRSLNNKRHFISDDNIKEIARIYGEFQATEVCKIYENEDFGYEKICVERPKRENGQVVLDKKGNAKPDSSLRDYESVPLKEDIAEYFQREVLPHVPDAWIDHSKTKRGYEINFNSEFYEYKPLRPLSEIRKDILDLEKRTEKAIKNIIS
ncbi:SAM-dependent DNA methyltransferase [Aureitalea sp. L0-47]|uniref:type I restriction-modification system subunit M n=1 Tax=Aureitalea sp. L0-47 TaxID=2816962 RepID=UPI00223859AD|nr:class I SAM-dependent DNA methyltransferase [Aureitalea sp. L0-47]MCW5518494.1 SAM-dependent DNA methyltransferase [Aureitalea sp. L0-47]